MKEEQRTHYRQYRKDTKKLAFVLRMSYTIPHSKQQPCLNAQRQQLW